MTPSKIDGLLVEQVDNELLVFNPATEEGHALNEAAAAVFQLCDAKTDRASMANVLASDCGLPDDPLVVDLALAELRDAGLVAVEQLPAGITRRSVIRQLGLSVMAAAALPLIETMVAARPAEAQTLPPGQPRPPRPTRKPKPKPAP